MRHLLLIIVILATCMAARVQSQTAAPRCAPAGTVTRVSNVPEASGLTASRVTPGGFWTHNDSGAAVLYALDSSGRVAGQVQVRGVTIDDLEAIHAGPCPEGACLYLGDIGDNQAERDTITIYRVVEPKSVNGAVSVAGAVHATYPDNAHDAEALLVTPDGTIAVVTKGKDAAVYRVGGAGKASGNVKLERVGARGSAKGTADDVEITDGAVSPDGRWVALRTNTALTFHAAADFFAGKWTDAGRVDLRPLREPQGEAVTFGPNNMLFVAGEGGGAGGGTFGRLTCGAAAGK